MRAQAHAHMHTQARAHTRVHSRAQSRARTQVRARMQPAAQNAGGRQRRQALSHLPPPQLASPPKSLERSACSALRTRCFPWEGKPPHPHGTQCASGACRPHRNLRPDFAENNSTSADTCSHALRVDTCHPEWPSGTSPTTWHQHPAQSRTFSLWPGGSPLRVRRRWQSHLTHAHGLAMLKMRPRPKPANTTSGQRMCLCLCLSVYVFLCLSVCHNSPRRAQSQSSYERWASRALFAAAANYTFVGARLQQPTKTKPTACGRGHMHCLFPPRGILTVILSFRFATSSTCTCDCLESAPGNSTSPVIFSLHQPPPGRQRRN